MIDFVSNFLWSFAEAHNRFFNALKYLLNPDPTIAPRAWFFNFLSVVVATLAFVFVIRHFCNHRLGVKRKIVERNLEEIGEEIGEDRNLEDEILWRDRWEGYLSPTVLFALIIVFGTSSVLGVVDLREGSNILTLGGAFKFSVFDGPNYTRGLVAFQWGFVGAFVYAIQDIVRRLVRLDLAPRALFGMSVRIIVASLVALAVELSLIPTKHPWAVTALAFSVGMFPRRGIYIIEEVAGRILRPRLNTKLTGTDPSAPASPEGAQGIKKLPQRIANLFTGTGSQSPDLPLTLISGISSWDRARLREEAVDTVRDLANTTLRTLVLNTPFEVGQLKDWKDQAELISHFTKEKELSDLRMKAGVCHASQFIVLCKETDGLDEIHALTNIDKTRLRIALITLTEVMKDPEKRKATLFTDMDLPKADRSEDART